MTKARNKINNKKGQIAIWVIVAMIIVVVVIFLLLIRRQSFQVSDEIGNPKTIIEQCAKDAVNEALDKMIPQGGFVSPDNYKTYKNIKITYLCENIGYFKPCVNQHPLLISEMQEEIKKYAEPRVEQCFKDMKNEFEKRNEHVELGAESKANVSLASNRVYYNIDRKVTVTKNGQSKAYESFDVEIASPSYEIANLAQNIVNQEAKYCYFEYGGYMLLYPRWDITKYTLSDSTKIYAIKDKDSNKEMNIAVRGCAIPAGL